LVWQREPRWELEIMYRRFISRGALGALALVATLGATDCEDFSTVTIPVTDRNAPAVFARIYWDGDETVDAGSYQRETDDEDATVLVAPVVLDSGGARRLQLWQTITVDCKEPDGGPALGAIFHLGLQSDEQSGRPGDRVSDGIYLVGTELRFGDYTRHCRGTSIVDAISYTFGAVGEDFAGHAASMSGEIVYRERGTCGCAPSGLGGRCLPSVDRCSTGHHPRCLGTSGCGGCACE
jgi:hypothetical protein